MTESGNKILIYNLRFYLQQYDETTDRVVKSDPYNQRLTGQDFLRKINNSPRIAESYQELKTKKRPSLHYCVKFIYIIK